jgi:hypothetical protein
MFHKFLFSISLLFRSLLASSIFAHGASPFKTLASHDQPLHSPSLLRSPSSWLVPVLPMICCVLPLRSNFSITTPFTSSCLSPSLPKPKSLYRMTTIVNFCQLSLNGWELVLRRSSISSRHKFQMGQTEGPQ